MRALCPPGSLLTWKSLPPRALPVWPVCVSICGAVAARRPGGQGLCLLLLPSCRVATRGQSSQDGRSALSPAAKAQTGESLCLNTPVRFHWAMNTARRGSLRARTALTTVPSEHIFPCNWRPEGRTSSEAVLRPGDPGPPLLLSPLACRPAARTRLPCTPVRSPCRGSAAWDALTCHSDPDWAPAITSSQGFCRLPAPGTHTSTCPQCSPHRVGTVPVPVQHALLGQHRLLVDLCPQGTPPGPSHGSVGTLSSHLLCGLVADIRALGPGAQTQW